MRTIASDVTEWGNAEILPNLNFRGTYRAGCLADCNAVGTTAVPTARLPLSFVPSLRCRTKPLDHRESGRTETFAADVLLNAIECE